MELRPGYQLTEVGIIPEDWDLVTVQKLVEEKILEKPLDGNHGGIHPKSSDYVDHGIPFVMANNFANGQVDLYGCKFISKERAGKLQKGFSISGDVLLTHKGTVGNTAIVGELSTEYIVLTPQVTYYRVSNTNRLDNRFLRHYFDSQSFQSLFVSLAGGGTRAYLGIVKQLALPVIQPPIEEQRSLATVLSDTDALIAALDRLIAKKRDLKQATMQQLLTGKTRMPGFGEGKEYKQTDIGVIPEDWKVKSLGSVLSKGRLGGNYPNQDTETDYPLMKMGNIARGYFDVSKVEFIAPGVRPEPDHRLVKRDILFNTRNTLELVGKVAIWLNELPVAYYNSNLMRLEFDSREVCSNEFANYALNTADTIARLRGLATGTTSVAAIYTRDLMGLHIIIPPLPEQRAIAQVLSDMDTEIAALEQRRDKTRALKQGMMQALLTGRIRLG